MDWLTDHKIPVGKVAKTIFDWMKDNLSPLFDAISAMMDAMIAGILWVLQTPHPLVIIAAFIALTWYLQRNWKICLGVLLGFLFILNQGYWEETTESLTLILSACVVCMGIGVPVGIAAAHRPRRFLRFISTFSFQLSAFASVRTPTPCLGKTSFNTLKPGRRRGNF